MKKDNLKPNDYNKKLKGYDVVLLKNINQKAIQRQIYLTNLLNKECPFCKKSFMDYVNVVPINTFEGIKVPGKYCVKCDMFWEERGAELLSLISEFSNFSEYDIHTEYLVPDYSEKNKLLKKLKSLSVVIFLKLKKQNKHKIIAVVMSKSERNIEKDVFHYTDFIARQLLYSISQNSIEIQIENDKYEILKYSYSDNNFPEFITIEKIYLKSGGGLYNKSFNKDSEFVDILLYSPFKNCLEVAHASYDKIEKIYYMDSKVFRKFINEFGNPGIKVLVYNCGNSDFAIVKDESILHAYGYSVAQNKNFSDNYRHILLSEVMDLGLMTAKEIISLLEWNINTSQSKDNFKEAVKRWNIDRNFVMNYKVDPKRFVISIVD